MTLPTDWSPTSIYTPDLWEFAICKKMREICLKDFSINNSHTTQNCEMLATLFCNVLFTSIQLNYVKLFCLSAFLWMCVCQSVHPSVRLSVCMYGTLDIMSVVIYFLCLDKFFLFSFVGIRRGFLLCIVFYFKVQ